MHITTSLFSTCGEGSCVTPSLGKQGCVTPILGAGLCDIIFWGQSSLGGQGYITPSFEGGLGGIVFGGVGVRDITCVCGGAGCMTPSLV